MVHESGVHHVVNGTLQFMYFTTHVKASDIPDASKNPPQYQYTVTGRVRRVRKEDSALAVKATANGVVLVRASTSLTAVLSDPPMTPWLVFRRLFFDMVSVSWHVPTYVRTRVVRWHWATSKTSVGSCA